MENPVDILSHHNGVIWLNDLFKHLYFFDTFKGYSAENGYADWNIVFEIEQYMNNVTENGYADCNIVFEIEQYMYIMESRKPLKIRKYQ